MGLGKFLAVMAADPAGGALRLGQNGKLDEIRLVQRRVE
jgi:hypothetical protein